MLCQSSAEIRAAVTETLKFSVCAVQCRLSADEVESLRRLLNLCLLGSVVYKWLGDCSDEQRCV